MCSANGGFSKFDTSSPPPTHALTGIQAPKRLGKKTHKASRTAPNGCFDFKKGKCARGAECKYGHVVDGTVDAGAGAAEVESAAAAAAKMEPDATAAEDEADTAAKANAEATAAPAEEALDVAGMKVAELKVRVSGVVVRRECTPWEEEV